MLKLNRKDVLLQLNLLFDQHNSQSDDKFTYVDSGSDICVFSLKGAAFPIRITSDGVPWTFSRSLDGISNAEQYAKLCFNSLRKASNEIAVFLEYPANEIIDPTYSLYLTDMDLRTDISLEDFRNYIKYMYATKQTCSECKVGVINVEVSSYSEEHTCLNCGIGKSIC